MPRKNSTGYLDKLLALKEKLPIAFAQNCVMCKSNQNPESKINPGAGT
jgi:hypothetical protein